MRLRGILIFARGQMHPRLCALSNPSSPLSPSFVKVFSLPLHLRWSSRGGMFGGVVGVIIDTLASFLPLFNAAGPESLTILKRKR